MEISERKQSVYDEYFIRPAANKSNSKANLSSQSFKETLKSDDYPYNLDPKNTPTLVKAK